MADQVDQLYALPSADEQKLAKHNRLAAGGRFRQTSPADVPYVLVALKTTALGNETQRRNLETAIEAINGVDVAKVLVYGMTPPEADVPTGHHIDAVGDIRFRLEPDG